nr:hypothetical protein [Angustibacter aerolatus]
MQALTSRGLTLNLVATLVERGVAQTEPGPHGARRPAGGAPGRRQRARRRRPRAPRAGAAGLAGRPRHGTPDGGRLRSRPRAARAGQPGSPTSATSRRW